MARLSSPGVADTGRVLWHLLVRYVVAVPYVLPASGAVAGPNCRLGCTEAGSLGTGAPRPISLEENGDGRPSSSWATAWRVTGALSM